MVHLCGIEPTQLEAQSYLNPIRDMGSYTNVIIDAIEQGFDVLPHSCDQGYLPASAANLMLQRASSATQNIIAMQIPSQPTNIHKKKLPVSPPVCTLQDVVKYQHGTAQ